MKRCLRCGLPEKYPGIMFDKNGLCNYCAYYDLYKEREKAIQDELKDEFYRLLNTTKRKKNRYDCIVAYSGGKDSTYLLYYLKTKLKLKNILAHTLDNGFVSKTALQNIKTITDNLGVESRITKPDPKLLKDVFRYALTTKDLYPKELSAMLSQVCSVCWGMVFGTTINMATELRIPLMFFGFTPGQYPTISLENFMKVKSCIFLSEKVYKDDPWDVLKIIADPIKEKFGEKIGKYYFNSVYIPKGLFVPKILLPFHALVEYDEKKILSEIAKLGWKKPTDTDSCSTNCLLNSIGNYASVRQNGYHPYVGENSYFVRTGKMSRKDLLAIEALGYNEHAIKLALRELNLKKEQL